jgi:hypothetical protein
VETETAALAPEACAPNVPIELLAAVSVTLPAVVTVVVPAT